MVYCISEYYEGLSEINNHISSTKKASERWTSAVHLHSANYSVIVLIKRPTKKAITNEKLLIMWLGNIEYWRRLHGEYFEYVTCINHPNVHLNQYSFVCLLQIFLSIETFPQNVRRIVSATPCTMWHIAHLSSPFSQTQRVFAAAASIQP